MMPGQSTAPLVHIVTLGCAKNEVDSDNMRAMLLQAGFRVEQPAAGDAVAQDGEWGELSQGEAPQAVIVNSCAFIEQATQESIDTVLQLAAQCSQALELGAPQAPALIVCGCMPSRYGAQLDEALPEVDAFVNVADEDQIVEVVAQLVGWDYDEVEQDEGVPELPVQRTTGQPFAYVKISDGCNRFCSFCTIPYIRGRYRSRTTQQIVGEVDWLVGQGVREIVLIGQDTGVWGDDFACGELHQPLPDATLPSLVEFLAQRHPHTWIRVMYLQPQRVSDRLLQVMAAHDNVCSYLDIPLQHASAQVIADMNRQGDGQQYLQMLQHIRRELPGATLRTTVISGFPGETAQQAEELEQFMRDAAFDFAGVFEYSQEEGTVAGDRDDQVPAEVAVERAQRVRDIIEEAGNASAAARVGQVHQVLVCGIDELDDEFGSPQLDGTNVAADAQGNVRMWGRARFQAPDVDSVIYFDAPPSSLGEFVNVLVTGSVGYDLEGEVQHG